MKKYFDNDFSKEIWEQNYKGPEDKTVEDTWRRVAKEVASIEKDKEKWEEIFFELLKDWKFSPGGRIVANIGIDDLKGTTLMNCFVHCPIDLNIKNLDSINGIYDMIKAQAITLKSEGGYGCVGNNSKVLKIKSVTVNKKIYYLNNEKDLKFLKKNNII